MIKPVNSKCFVCQNDLDYQHHLREINEAKNELVDSWIKTPTKITLKMEWEKVVLNEKGEATSMPSFSSYRELWQKNMLQSPFDFNWKTMDRCLPWDRNYIRLVEDVMKKQMTIWMFPDTDLFKKFETFYDALCVVVGQINGLYGEENESTTI